MTHQLHPVRGKTYRLSEVYDLDLKDSPHLGFFLDGAKSVIQDSHVTVEEILSIPNFPETLWQYKYTTKEWIPVFHYVGDQPITDFIYTEPYKDCFGVETKEVWSTFKAFPRSQI